MSLASLLSIARSALLAQQRAMAVTAHNVANAQTPGYSRQRVNLEPAEPLRLATGLIGRGVTDSGITRARDAFLDAAYRRESGFLGTSSTLSGFLAQVEAAVDEPSDLGIASLLDGLFQSFSDLASDPASAPTRDLVRRAATRFVEQLHQLDDRLSQVTQDSLDRLQSDVAGVNDLARRIADLNVQILALGGPSGNAPDLQDERDLLVDQLAEKIDVRVLAQDDGTISVLAGGTVLVAGSTAQTLSAVALPAGGYALQQSGGGQVAPAAGSLKGLLDLLDTTLPGLRGQLDGFAQAVVTEVNTIHRTGFTLAGATGTDFFDPSGVTAGTIQLAPGVLASTDGIAAGATAAPGDGTVAARLAALGSTALPAQGGRTLRQLFTEFAETVGSSARDASQDEAVRGTMADQADAQRTSVSGVSLDEEMTLLIGQQQAYSAATRIVKVAEDMIQEILQIL